MSSEVAGRNLRGVTFGDSLGVVVSGVAAQERPAYSALAANPGEIGLHCLLACRTMLADGRELLQREHPGSALGTPSHFSADDLSLVHDLYDRSRPRGKGDEGPSQAVDYPDLKTCLLKDFSDRRFCGIFTILNQACGQANSLFTGRKNRSNTLFASGHDHDSYHIGQELNPAALRAFDTRQVVIEEDLPCQPGGAHRTELETQRRDNAFRIAQTWLHDNRLSHVSQRSCFN